MIKKTLIALPIAGAFALSACGGDTGAQTAAPETSAVPAPAPETSAVPAPAPETSAVPAPAPPTTNTESEPKIPVELQNAINSAESYVEMSGFSKKGLLNQLEFEGYPSDVATKAVEKLDVNWKAEAVESAKSYMDMMSFSRSGLIQQLSSEAGDGFTQEQAEYAADQVF